MSMKGKENKKGEKAQYLYHYLSLEYLIQILKNGQLSFCNPDYWDDKNDAFFANLATPKDKAIGVICFTKTRETCTHWKTFASNGIGVKISFHQKQLIDSLKKNIEQNEEILENDVYYKSRENVLKANIPEIKKEFTPLFLKKSAYVSENEYRVVCVVNEKECGFGKIICQVKISLSCISRITISPYVRKSVANDVIKLIKAYIDSLIIIKKESLNIEVKRSTMMYDKKWQMAGRKLVNQIGELESNLEIIEK